MTDANEYIRQGLKGEEAFEHFNQFNQVEALCEFKGILDRDDIYSHENMSNRCYYSSLSDNKNKSDTK